MLHSFLHAGRESEYSFAWDPDKGTRTNTRKFIDRLAPDMFRPHADYFEMNDMVGRTMMLRTWGTSIRDDFFTRLADVHTNLVATSDIVAVSNSEARKLIERKMTV